MAIKWGVISTANIALTQFIPAIYRANMELIAIASRGPKVHDVAKNLHVKRAYESYDELLQDSEVEAVYIPLPNDLHVEWVVKAAQAGKHILCEKPIALTKDEFKQMQRVCKENGVVFMEAFMYQFHPQYQVVKDFLTQGAIGDIKLYQSSHSFLLEDRTTNIRMDATKGGGAMWDVGCYSFHALQNLLGHEVETVYANSVLHEQNGVDLTTSLIATLNNGVQANIDCSFDMFEQNEVTIVGSKGRIHLKNAFRPDRAGHIGEIIIDTANETRTVFVSGDIYRLEIEFFERLIKGEEDVAVQHQLSIQNIDVINAAYQSVATKQVVNVKDLS